MASINEAAGQFEQAAQHIDEGGKFAGMAQAALQNSHFGASSLAVAAFANQVARLGEHYSDAVTALEADKGQVESGASILHRVTEGSVQAEVTALPARAQELAHTVGGVALGYRECAELSGEIATALTEVMGKIQRLHSRRKELSQELDTLPAQHDSLATDIRSGGQSL